MITFNDGRRTASITEFDHKCGVLPSRKLVMLMSSGPPHVFEHHPQRKIVDAEHHAARQYEPHPVQGIFAAFA
jgi:hypothetical protein